MLRCHSLFTQRSSSWIKIGNWMSIFDHAWNCELFIEKLDYEILQISVTLCPAKSGIVLWLQPLVHYSISKYWKFRIDIYFSLWWSSSILIHYIIIYTASIGNCSQLMACNHFLAIFTHTFALSVFNNTSWPPAALQLMSTFLFNTDPILTCKNR